jgi:hypothetical protein
MTATALTFTATLFPPGNPFSADFYIKAEIEVAHFGSPETGRGYMADPMNYDPGSDPEWSVIGKPELFLDCGGDGEPVAIGEAFADALKDLIESDKDIAEQVVSKIDDFAGQDEYDADCAAEARREDARTGW